MALPDPYLFEFKAKAKLMPMDSCDFQNKNNYQNYNYIIKICRKSPFDIY